MEGAPKAPEPELSNLEKLEEAQMAELKKNYQEHLSHLQQVIRQLEVGLSSTNPGYIKNKIKVMELMEKVTEDNFVGTESYK